MGNSWDPDDDDDGFGGSGFPPNPPDDGADTLENESSPEKKDTYDNDYYYNYDYSYY